MRPVVCHIGIGSNEGDALQNCRRAVEEIACIESVSVVACSSFYRTEPVGYENQNDFVNAVLEITTSLAPREVLRALQGIEEKMGRVRRAPGGPRIIDLDILLYGQRVIDEEGLTIPHPEMHRRRFVLEPMCEIASFVVHPIFGVSMRGLKERLTDCKMVEKLNILN